MATRSNTEQQQHNAAEAILQNLARRPNVQSTLILARKDGSIIKVSGALLDEQDRESERPRAAVKEGSTETDAGEQRSTQVHLLARGVYEFVVAAESLGETVQAIRQRQQSAYSMDTYGDRGSDGTENAAQLARADVQLLRLRLTSQEVIIFPDPNYLCCVVQDLEGRK